jgi:hypothetical protein
MAAFEILGEVRDIETIAVGHGVYIRRYLERTHSRPLAENEGHRHGAINGCYDL